MATRNGYAALHDGPEEEAVADGTAGLREKMSPWLPFGMSRSKSEE